MTFSATELDRAERLEAKLDLLTEQVSRLTAEADIRQRQREDLDELRRDLSRISEGAMAAATRELELLEDRADLADTLRLARSVMEAAPALERAVVTLDQLSSLVDDLVPIGPQAMNVLTERLAEAERKGYFAFARAGVDVADRIVTGFDEDDLAQLGENVVTILETIKEITQPEMLELLGHTVDAVRSQRQVVDHEPGEPPSLWALVRQLRDPDVRRGMARAIGTLRAVSVETGPGLSRTEVDTTKEGEQ